MIITCKKEVPRRWIAFAILPWASFTFNGGVVGVAFLFSLKKFIENPAALTFVLSLPSLLGILVSPVASFLSDTVWTRVGRRKPFIIVSWAGMIVSMALMPLMPNFWLLLGAYILYQVASSLNAPMEPLKQEIIPPHERGWATGAMTWCSNLATMAFYVIMLGRFDEVGYFAGMRLDGEWVIYWSAALLLGVLLLLIMLGIRETDPKSPLRGQRFTLRNFAGGLADRELWPVYLLVVGNSCMNFYAGLGALSNLLYTDQWGYTKQEMGVNVAVGGIVNLFIIGMLTVFADRLNRMKAYQTTLCLSLLANVLYYCYVEFVLPDHRPTLVEIILFGESISAISILTGLLYVPLVYDYVRRNRMGTYGAGASIVTTLARTLTLNGVGLFVSWYALVFRPPAGEMARVVLRDDTARLQLVAAFDAKDRGGIAAEVWQADGMTAASGRTWEIRLRDASSEELAKEKQALEAERSPLLSKQAITGGDKYARRIAEIGKRIGEIDGVLGERTVEFRKEVSGALGARLISEGDQIVAASCPEINMADLSVARRPDGRVVETMLKDLKHENPAIIDLRPTREGESYGLSVSALSTGGAGIGRELEAEVRQREPGLLGGEAPRSVLMSGTAITLELLVAEQPEKTYVSPVTRIVNMILGLAGHPVDPVRQLSAMARNLRQPDGSSHVRVTPGRAARTISVTAIFVPGASPPLPVEDAAALKLKSLLGANAQAAAQAEDLYRRAEKAAAAQRITVAHPVLASGYAPAHYDYMSGYLWMFVMGTIGIALTLVFSKLEAAGVVRKRGVEEAEAS